MKFTKASASRSKTGKCRITTLLVVLMICAIAALAPLYRHVLTTTATPSPESSGRQRQSPETVRRHREEGQLKIQRRRRPPPPPASADPRGSAGIPYIGVDEFERKYSAKYKGLVPAAKRDSSDPSCGRRPDFFDFFLLPKSERSRFHEDKIIYDLFKNNTIPSSPGEESPLPRGTYVELGAFDGREESNTMFFDKCLGWDGLLIEAQSKSYEKVVANRPHAVKLSFSPTCTGANDSAKFYDYPMSNNGMEGLAKSYTGKQTVEVPCGPLTPVLQDVFGPGSRISFFSLDVEGAEMMVLKTIDFDAVYIEVVMVEVQNTHCPEPAKCPNVLNIRRHMALTRKYALFVNFLEASDVYVLAGTEAWRRAVRMQQERQAKMERDIRDHMMRERQQLIG